MRWFITLKTMKQHEIYMKAALDLAIKAQKADEVPVGAVIVCDGKIVAKAYNKREKNNDPLGHAELKVIKKASKKLKSWRLVDCDLYVTLEPCAMCAGAISWSRIRTVIYAADDKKGGALGGAFDMYAQKGLNHKPKIISGILQHEASAMLTNFFKAKRELKQGES